MRLLGVAVLGAASAAALGTLGLARTNQGVDRRAIGIGDVAEYALGFFDLETWEFGNDVVGRVQEVGIARAPDAVGQVRPVVAYE